MLVFEDATRPEVMGQIYVELYIDFGSYHPKLHNFQSVKVEMVGELTLI